MNEMNKISVVVPIYKVEKYLNKCIDSLINQTYKNLEIILVDDGSPDNCGKICDDYAGKDNRIIVIHKVNGGLSDARNVGVKIATGKWIVFVDSDDYVSNDYIEYLFKLVSKSNSQIGIVMPYEISEDYIENKIQPKEKIKIMDNLTALKVMLYQKKFDTAAWGKIYSMDVVKDIEFPKGKIYEDIGTVYKYFLKSKKIIYSNKKIYYYLQRSDSIMGVPFNIRDLDYPKQAKILMNDIKNMNDKKLLSAAQCRYINANFSILLKIRKSKQYEKERKELLLNIKKYRLSTLLNINSRFKTKVALILTYINYF